MVNISEEQLRNHINISSTIPDHKSHGEELVKGSPQLRHTTAATEKYEANTPGGKDAEQSPVVAGSVSATSGDQYEDIEYSYETEIEMPSGHSTGVAFQGEEEGGIQSLGKMCSWTKDEHYIENFSISRIKNGTGKLTYSDGSFYEGQWLNGKRHGCGRLFYNSDKTSYKRQWVNDNKNGYGRQTYSDKSSYEGEWRDDIISGFGTYSWPNGAKYVGHYVNGNRDGEGTYYYDNTSTTFKYEGSFKNGLKQGYGTLFWTDGTFYRGDWYNDNKHGSGYETYSDGS